ncbi:hypothetical protein DFH28DRAFT_1191935, partial [Melampsora americana]
LRLSAHQASGAHHQTKPLLLGWSLAAFLRNHLIKLVATIDLYLFLFDMQSHDRNTTIVDTHFERRKSGNSFNYWCRLCKGRTMKEKNRHKNSANHKAMVASHEASIALEIENKRRLDAENEVDNPPQFAGFGDDEPNDDRIPEENIRFGYSEALMKLLTKPYSESGRSETSENEQANFNKLDLDTLIQRKLEEYMDSSQNESDSRKSNKSDTGNEDVATEPNQNSTVFDPDWYPFKKEV